MSVRPFLTLAAIAALAAAPAAAGARGSATKIELHTTKLGPILVDQHGYTVYAFTKDTRNHDACAAIFECLSLWPAVTSQTAPIAGQGVKSSLLGTIKFRNGRRQLTYAG